MNIQSKVNDIYSKILKNKLITVCILFTVFTLLDTIPILVGLWPAKEGIGPYVHLLGRFILHSILVAGLYLFDILRKRLKSKIVIYIITFFLTWSLLLVYVWSNSLFTELHPDAFKDVSISYAFMYILLGIVAFIGNRSKSSNKSN
ncbi:DUF6608 family protein [Alkaliphilus transvaalensis]|uniref:DUF6608 family protein n=1 Tax=Alkaliphilus transvaalensis TaxID=114628 RepID=UPI00047D9B7F|nr:DUF6608 family protein [Alkaliphilus transvaalensis]